MSDDIGAGELTRLFQNVLGEGSEDPKLTEEAAGAVEEAARAVLETVREEPPTSTTTEGEQQLPTVPEATRANGEDQSAGLIRERGAIPKRPPRLPTEPTSSASSVSSTGAGDTPEQQMGGTDGSVPPSGGEEEGVFAGRFPLTAPEEWVQIRRDMKRATDAFDEAVAALRRAHSRLTAFEDTEDPVVLEMLRESALPVRARAQAAGLDACFDAASRRRQQLLDKRRHEEEQRQLREEQRLQREREKKELLARLQKQEEDLRYRQREMRRRLEQIQHDEGFAELEAKKAEAKRRAWEEHPEKFFCYVCGLPGVRRPKYCPRKDEHYKFY